MRAGIVHTDVLADHTATRFALALVFLGLLDSPAVKHVIFGADKFHQP